MNQKVIDELVAADRITRVPVNLAGSRTLLAQAARHLERWSARFQIILGRCARPDQVHPTQSRL